MSSLKFAALAIFAFISPSLASRFEFTECYCGVYGGYYARSHSVNFFRQDGKEASVSGNYVCSETDGNRPNACTVWLLSNNCIDTGICGVGELCYNVDITSSDKFSVNGQTFTKNDYSHDWTDLHGSDVCDALCSTYGQIQAPGNFPSAKWTIEGWEPEPHACS